ncbi:hypothetical protein C0033_01625 [Clostridium sp. chh4-2]|uniref:jacalin-like lectin n=1 Tax=Clostridium sp. chh4-2 TaxID=2067550 RepID=UPI000CCE9BCB|nr:hypothetical protein [Clostridium sp. chh4-2]PNV64044.1 hypothetical protein C0033_01625 [Clostridium sp. chh4-2]
MAKVTETAINESIRIPSNDPRFEKSNGKVYSDRIPIRCGYDVTGVRIAIGDGLVNGIQFIYNNNPALSECHGSSEGNLIETKFDSDEYITVFSWISGCNFYYSNSAGVFTWHIQITTNKSRYTYGEEPAVQYCFDKKTYTLEADRGHKIVGIRCKARCSDKDSQPTDKAGTCGIVPNVLYAISHVYEYEVEPIDTYQDTYYSDYSFVVNADKLTGINGAVCDNCINRLQFVYDNNSGITKSHGCEKEGEVPFNFPIGDAKLVNFKYTNAKCDDEKYGGSVLLTQITATLSNGKTYSAGLPKSSLPSTFYHKHNYELTAEPGEELWAFTGLYNHYMGGFLSRFTRKNRNIRNLAAAGSGSKNTTGNKILFVNVVGAGNGKDKVDESAKLLNRYWRNWFNGHKEKIEDYDCIPAKSCCNQVVAKVDGSTVQNYLLTGQYEYVAFHCHGNSFYVGNGIPLLSSVWVMQNQAKFKNACKNTVFNLNCCECGYRGTYHDGKSGKDIEGLAVTLVKYGAKAAYAYSVALSIPAIPAGVSEMPQHFTLLYRLLGAVDYYIIEQKLDINNVTENVLKEFDLIMDTLSSKCSKYGLNGNILKKISDDFNNEMKKEGFVETSEIFCLNEKSRYDNFMRYLSNESIHRLTKEIYILYWQVYFAKQHFCGPGVGNYHRELKKKNLGEACNEYGNSGYIPDL